MTAKVGITLNAPEIMPTDLYQESRTRPLRKNDHTLKKKDKLKGFLEKDRMVLQNLT